MVIPLSKRRSGRNGSLILELLVAMAILLGALMPIAYSFTSEHRLARGYYEHAIAMEIVDGEMEVLAAGQWRDFEPGTHEYTVHAGAAANLPPGHFTLTVLTNKIRLEWRSDIHHYGGAVAREATVQ